MSAATAKARALVTAAKLDEYWSHLCMTDPDLLGKQLLKVQARQLEQCYLGSTVTLQEAMEVYLSAKGKIKVKPLKQQWIEPSDTQWKCVGLSVCMNISVQMRLSIVITS